MKSGYLVPESPGRFRTSLSADGATPGRKSSVSGILEARSQ